MKEGEEVEDGGVAGSEVSFGGSPGSGLRLGRVGSDFGVEAGLEEDVEEVEEADDGGRERTEGGQGEEEKVLRDAAYAMKLYYGRHPEVREHDDRYPVRQVRAEKGEDGAAVAPLTLAQRREVVREAERKLEEMLREADEHAPGWESTGESDGVKCWAGAGDAAQAKGRGFIPFPRAALFPHMADISVRHLTDSQWDWGRPVERLDLQGETDVDWAPYEREVSLRFQYGMSYFRFKSMTVVSARDFANMTHFRVLPDGTLLCLAYSPDSGHAAIPDLGNQGLVRGRILIGGWVCRPKPGLDAAISELAPSPEAWSDRVRRHGLDKACEQLSQASERQGCECTYVVRLEVGGTIPQFVVRTVTSQQSMIVAAVRKQVEREASRLSGRGFSDPKSYPPLRNRDVVSRRKFQALVSNISKTASSTSTTAAPAAQPAQQPSEEPEKEHPGIALHTVKDVAGGAVRRLVRLATTEDDKWTGKTGTGTVQESFVGDSAGARASRVMRCSPDTVLHILRTPELKRRADSSMREEKELASWGKRRWTVQHRVLNGSAVTSAREFVTATTLAVVRSSTNALSDIDALNVHLPSASSSFLPSNLATSTLHSLPAGTIVIASASLADSSSVAPASGTVRGRLIVGGWVLRPAVGGGTVATYVVVSDPGGGIPAFLVNRALATQMALLESVDNVANSISAASPDQSFLSPSLSVSHPQPSPSSDTTSRQTAMSAPPTPMPISLTTETPHLAYAKATPQTELAAAIAQRAASSTSPVSAGAAFRNLVRATMFAALWLALLLIVSPRTATDADSCAAPNSFLSSFLQCAAHGLVQSYVNESSKIFAGCDCSVWLPSVVSHALILPFLVLLLLSIRNAATHAMSLVFRSSKSSSDVSADATPPTPFRPGRSLTLHFDCDVSNSLPLLRSLAVAAASSSGTPVASSRALFRDRRAPAAADSALASLAVKAAAAAARDLLPLLPGAPSLAAAMARPGGAGGDVALLTAQFHGAHTAQWNAFMLPGAGKASLHSLATDIIQKSTTSHAASNTASSAVPPLALVVCASASRAAEADVDPANIDPASFAPGASWLRTPGAWPPPLTLVLAAVQPKAAPPTGPPQTHSIAPGASPRHQPAADTKIHPCIRVSLRLSPLAAEHFLSRGGRPIERMRSIFQNPAKHLK